MLLSYHRRLRMISEALELRMKGGQVSHSLCMCVISHGYGGLSGTEKEVVGGMHAGQSRPGVQLWVGSSRNWLVYLERP